jgi:hypothetical protein
MPIDKFGRHCRQPSVITLRPTVFDRYVAALAEPGLVEAAAESGNPGSIGCENLG